MMTTQMPTPSYPVLENIETVLPVTSRLQSLKLWLTKTWNGFFEELFCENYLEPSITQLQGQDGEYFWEIYDSRTHKTIYCMTDYEVMEWLDSRHYRQ
jgi:hypothetical protein